MTAAEYARLADFPDEPFGQRGADAYEILDGNFLAERAIQKLIVRAGQIDYVPRPVVLLEECLQYVLSPDRHFFVSFDGEEPSGFVLLDAIPSNAFAKPTLVFMFVDPESKSGRHELIRYLEYWLDRNDHDSVQCVTRPDVPVDVYTQKWGVEMLERWNPAVTGTVIGWTRKEQA